MPIDLYNEDGEKIEGALTPDEVKELRDRADRASQLESELASKSEEKPENENIKNMREKIKKLEKIAKSSGVELDESGSPIENVTPDFVRKASQEENMKFYVEMKKKEELAKYGESAAEIEETFNALTNGKNVDNSNFMEYLQKAVRANGVDEPQQDNSRVLRNAVYSRGSTPRVDDTPFSDTQEGRAFAEQLGITVAVPKEVNPNKIQK